MDVIGQGGDWGPIRGFWFPGPEIYMAIGGADRGGGRDADYNAGGAAVGHQWQPG